MSEDEDIAHISGNASDEIKRLLGKPSAFLPPPDTHGLIFGRSITERLVVTEISFHNKAEEPEKLEGRVVCEVTVEEDMVNAYGVSMEDALHF